MAWKARAARPRKSRGRRSMGRAAVIAGTSQDKRPNKAAPTSTSTAAVNSPSKNSLTPRARRNHRSRTRAPVSGQG